MFSKPLLRTMFESPTFIKQVAHCDRNDGSRQNGIVAHLQRTGGSFGRRLFTYFLYKCCNFFFFHKCTPFFNVLLSYLYIRHAGSGKSFIFFKNFKKIFCDLNTQFMYYLYFNNITFQFKAQ